MSIRCQCFSCIHVTVNKCSYQVIPPASSKLGDEDPENVGPNVEMVTVPALGAEWGKEDLRGMTKAAKKEERQERRALKFKLWNRDQRGIGGTFLTRRNTVILLFAVIAA